MESSPVLAGKVKASVDWMRSQPLSWLVIGQIMAAIAGLLYGKLTAIYIPPAELGIYNLFFAGMMFLYTLLISPTIQSFKATLTRQAVSKAATEHGTLLLVIYGITLLLITALIGLGQMSGLLLIVWFATLGQGLYAVGNDYLNVKGRYKELAGVQISYAVVNLLLFILICVKMDWRTAGGLWCSLALINLLFAGISTRHLWNTIAADQKWTVSWPSFGPAASLRAIRQYALPLTGMALWAWLINYADRYLIRFYLTDDDVGLYAMSYSLGSKLVILSTPFVTYLSGVAIRQKVSGDFREKFPLLQSKYVLGYTSIASIICVGFFIGQDWIGNLLLSDKYTAAFQIAPLIAISYLFLTVGHLLEVKWYVFGNTNYILYHNILGALINVGLNCLLIPIFGLKGAAFSMIGSTACQLIFILFILSINKK